MHFNGSANTTSGIGISKGPVLSAGEVPRRNSTVQSAVFRNQGAGLLRLLRDTSEGLIRSETRAEPLNSGGRLRNEEDARAWEGDDALPQREEELCGHQCVTRNVLEQWLPGDTTQNSLPFAEKLQQIIRESIASRSRDNDSPWFALCDLMQAATGRSSDRVTPSFSTSAICALLERHGVMSENHPPENLVDTDVFTQRQRELERLATDSWGEGMTTLVSEIVAVRSMSVPAEVNEVTRLDDRPVDCDRREREDLATALNQKATEVVPGSRETDGTLGSGSSPTCGTDAGAVTVENNKSRHFLFEEDIPAEEALQAGGPSPNGPNAVAETATKANDGCPPDGGEGATAPIGLNKREPCAVKLHECRPLLWT